MFITLCQNLVFPSLLEDMLTGADMIDGYDREDHFSSGSSSSINNSSSRSITPLSEMSNDASYDAGGISSGMEELEEEPADP